MNAVGVCWQQKHTDVCEDGTINLPLASNGAVITGGRAVDRTLRTTTDRKKRSLDAPETNSSLSVQQARQTGSDETHKPAADRPQGQSMMHYGKLHVAFGVKPPKARGLCTLHSNANFDRKWLASYHTVNLSGYISSVSGLFLMFQVKRSIRISWDYPPQAAFNVKDLSRKSVI